MTPPRTIVHFDLDAFFVSVECILDPSLKGLPLLVGGHSDRGVVAACSYEARKYGIHSAMPMRTAMRLCPHATVRGSTRGAYSKYSRWVTEIIAAKAPLVEKASIDEFYLDLTGMNRFFDPYKWTIDLREEIMDKTKLPISFAIASNKMISKIATNEAKPNGYIQVPHGREKEFLAPLKVNKIPGVGEQTFLALQQLGIETIRDLGEHNIQELERRLGKYGVELWNKAQGIHEGEVIPYHESKSISTENTFEENKTDIPFLMAELVRMTERVGYELRQENKTTGCIAVKIRYPDFETTSRQVTIPYTFYDDELIAKAKELFHKLYRKGQAIRLLGVRLSELTGGSEWAKLPGEGELGTTLYRSPVQTNLFENIQKKTELYKAIDEVKNRFGKDAIVKAGGSTRRSGTDRGSGGGSRLASDREQGQTPDKSLRGSARASDQSERGSARAADQPERSAGAADFNQNFTDPDE